MTMTTFIRHLLSCATILSCCDVTRAGSIQLENPVDHMVLQRSNQNKAYVQVKGAYITTQVLISDDLPATGGGTTGSLPDPATTVTALSQVEVRFTPVQPTWGTAVGWTNIPVSGTHFVGQIELLGGWYTMELRAYSAGQLIATTQVARVGVGEVFAITGHSNAQGGHSPSTVCEDERVVSINRNVKWGKWQTQSNYCKVYSSMNTITNNIAPYGSAPWCWGHMGDKLVKTHNVPVLLYSAAFGGTSSEHWGKSANGEYFDHSFVRWNWRMPYTNLYSIVHDMAPRTGMRAFLALHGENDEGLTQDDIVRYQTNYFHKARMDGNMPGLAVVLARSTGKTNEYKWDTIVSEKQYASQQQAINLPDTLGQPGSYFFSGPELWLEYPNASNRISPSDIHYSTVGQHTFGVMWADSLTPSFFSNSIPYPARFQ